MDEIVVPNKHDDRALFQQVIAQHGGPAFMRRAQRAEGALMALRDRLAGIRGERLDMVTLRLGVAVARAGSWQRLEGLLDAESIVALRQLHADLQPQLRTPVAPAASDAQLRAALADLEQSIERFNRRWLAVVRAADLSDVNQRRDEYNRWYVLEKECAVGSVRVARQGFQPLPPITVDDLLAWFPLLPTVLPASS
jgi:hypothetical protein